MTSIANPTNRSNFLAKGKGSTEQSTAAREPMGGSYVTIVAPGPRVEGHYVTTSAPRSNRPGSYVTGSTKTVYSVGGYVSSTQHI